MAGRPNGTWRGSQDPAEIVGDVLAAKREVLLRVHGHRLQREDLEDCLSQAALELIGRARENGLEGERHIASALERRFLSRVTDRQRALAGRSAIAAATHAALRIGAGSDPDHDGLGALAASDGDASEAATKREELKRLREVAAELTHDQRLVLACQVSLGMESAEFCARFGWSPEKFRKVAQRARARLRQLVGEYELGERCRRLEADLVAYAARAASGPQAATVREHVANCAGCAAFVRDLRLASDRVGAVLPIPPLAASGLAVQAGLLAKVAAAWRAVTAPLVRGGAPATGAGTGSAAAGTAAGIAKTGVAAVCVAALAGGGHWLAPRVLPSEPRAVAHPAIAAAAPTAPTEAARSLSRPTGGALISHVAAEGRHHRGSAPSRKRRGARSVPAHHTARSRPPAPNARPAAAFGRGPAASLTASAGQLSKSGTSVAPRLPVAPKSRPGAAGEFDVE